MDINFYILSQDKSGEDDQLHNLPPSLLESPSDLLYVHNLWVPNKLLIPYICSSTVSVPDEVTEAYVPSSLEPPPMLSNIIEVPFQL